jgi:hypothetical protein
MPSKFPGPYVNDTKQDDAIMHYVRGGGFDKTDIGARSSGLPKNIKNDVSIDHVGDATGNPVKSKFP